MAIRMSILLSLLVAIIEEAQLGGFIGGLLGSSVNVQGIVFCTHDGNIGVNGPATRFFPQILSSLLANCSVVVKTPLSTCNANLPAVGVLQAPLQFAGDTLVGLLKILSGS